LRGKTAEDFRLLELIDPVAQAEGYEVVRLRLMAGDRARRLQILAERPDGTMPVESCAALARAISRILDAADPISGGLVLEVSSPGIDRPLTRPQDFEAWKGCEARVEIDRLVEGRKRFKGVLAGAADGEVVIAIDGEPDPVRLPFSWLTEAKLVLNDALLERGAAARAARLVPASTAQAFDHPKFDHEEHTP
jgi:ribosome maturation factor RimP